MTPEQQATLKAHIPADPAWAALPLNSDTSYFIADELRKEASPAFVVWKTSVSADAITDVCIGYDSDTTGGTDANIVPLTWHDFAVTPNGGDITVDVPTAGFYRATSAT